VGAPFRVIVRRGPRVDRLPAATLEQALALLEAHGRAAAAGPGRNAVDLRVRRFEPVQQVAARLELRGPGRGGGGVDVRGDGSAEAWTGRLRRRVLEAQEGEDAYATLRRVLQSTSVEP
jgi:hypothetical protein